MFFSGKNSGKLIGIDIGTTSVKTVELSKSGRALAVDRYSCEPLKSGLIVDNKIKDIDRVASSLRRALKKAGSKTRRGAVCVSSHDVISKLVTVQSGLKEDELESSVEIEADRLVPYALNEVNIDFINMGKSAAAAGEDNVQIVVCRKNIVEDLASVLEAAGIEPAVVDVDIFALARVYSLVNRSSKGGAGAKRISAMVDFRSSASKFMVFHNNNLIYNRETHFGGRQLIDGIDRKYGIPHDDALAALRRGDLPDSFKADVLKPFVKTLVLEVSRSLQFFYSSSTHDSIDELMLTGGCAHIGNLEKILEKQLQVPTVIMNPFASTRIGSKIDRNRFRKDIPSLTVAGGLAMRGLE